MIVAMNWPPFTAAELPPTLVNELQDILEPLYLATLELHRTVYRYELLAALGRDWEFVNKVNRTTAAPALNTIKGCINTAILISLCAFFDEAPGAVNLKVILNRVLRPDYTESLREFHRLTTPTFDVDRQRERLIRMQRRLNRGNTGRAIVRLSELRNQIVAHLDTQPRFEEGWPVIGDMTMVLAAVADVVISLVHFTIAGRRIKPSLGRQEAQLQARALCQAIQPVST
jgi:hypothetical protein